MSSDEILPALALSAKERAKLARGLLESLHQEGDPDVDAVWLDEIERRAQEVEDGSAQLVDWNVAREQIAQRLKARR
jgi:putative addiction module component (TIGR02574 family)